MQFSSIGSIQNHVKSMELQIKWQQKQKNPQTLTSHESAVSGQTQPGGKYNAFALEQKLKTGQKLSSEEMQYLRNSYPDLYSQAVDAERERDSYKSMLGACETKDDVMRANMHRVAALHDELTSVQNNPNLSQGEKFKRSVGIHMKSQAVSNEHAEFQRSGEYQKLPTEQELRDKENAAEKQHEKELENAAAKETEATEETTHQTGDHVDASTEPQAADGETGDSVKNPVSEPEVPRPTPETAATQAAPETIAPQPQAASYTRSGGYTQAAISTPGGSIDVGA